MSTSTSTGTLVGVGGGLERRIVGTREELASHSNPNGGGNGAGAGDADEEGQELIAPKRRTLSSLGLPFGLGAFGGSGTPLQPPPRRKRWTGGSFSSATSTGTGATGSASKWEKSSRRDRERAAISEDGHGYGGASNGYATHSRANGRPGSAGSLHSHRPGSSNGQSHRPGSSSGGTMYAHPHASGSSGTAGSFGVRSSIAGGGGGGGSNRGSVYAGSVRTFEEAGSMPREGAGAGSGAGGRARTPSVRTRAESVGTRESIREEEGERERDGEDEGRLSVNGHGYGDGRSERSVSTGTGRSRASSGAGHTSGNPNLNGNGNANGNANTNANGKTRRWSTLPRRLTPPASPPPAPPAVLHSHSHSGATIPHPYAAVASSSPDRDRDREPRQARQPLLLRVDKVDVARREARLHGRGERHKCRQRGRGELGQHGVRFDIRAAAAGRGRLWTLWA
ncbi:hypothetical protein B0H16DRAFT_307911 [Mycena metata]|uniref:Uncharacterized protein n=1 Tax=Mycena metata TaxID=1033252 RepID=A0AAD7P2E9_9AGAR|nr:hypothetical protein B0H16DRAFT_307911 [Mycena metata]